MEEVKKKPETYVFKSPGKKFAERYDLRKLYLGFQRHIFAIISLVLLFTALGSWATWYYLAHYRAEAVVLYKENMPKALPGGIALHHLSVATALDLITLPSHIQSAKTILGLDIPVHELEKMVEVPLPRNDSHLIRIIAKSDNPHLSIALANVLAQIAVKNSGAYSQSQLKLELENFKNKLLDANIELAKSLQEIEEYKKAHRYFEMTADHTTLVKQIDDARSKMQNAHLNFNSLLVEYQNFKRQAEIIPDQVEKRISTPPPPNPHETRISFLQASLAEAKAKYALGNPKIHMIQDELDTLLAQSPNRAPTVETFYEKNAGKEKLHLELMLMESKVRASQKMEQELAQLVSHLEKELVTLPTNQMAFSKLLKAKLNAEERVSFLANSVDSIQLMLNIPKGGLELYQRAEKAKPLQDSWWVKTLPLFGLFSGLFFGITAALLLEICDPHFRTVKQLEMAYHLPTLSLIPQLPALANKTKQNLFFIRNLVERLEKIPSFPSQATISITSSTKKEGKSFIAENLACYYSCMGKKVLLMEFDPSFYTSENGFVPLENYLTGDANKEVIIVSGQPDRIKLEKVQPFMKELFKAEKMAELMRYLKLTYERIIIDAPGVLDSDYTTNAAELSDISLFVIGSSIVSHHQVDESLRALAHVGVIPNGLILNRVPPRYMDDQRIKMEMNRHKSRFWT